MLIKGTSRVEMIPLILQLLIGLCLLTPSRCEEQAMNKMIKLDKVKIIENAAMLKAAEERHNVDNVQMAQRAQLAREKEAAELIELVKTAEAAPCACPGCCPRPVPRCCDVRCPKCLGGDVPIPGRKCINRCPGGTGGCPPTCPCDACVCCYTSRATIWETRTCEDIAVLFYIGLEVSTVSILETTVVTETGSVTFTGGDVFVFTSVSVSTSFLSESTTTTTLVETTSVTTTVIVGLTTTTLFVPTQEIITVIVSQTTTPIVDIIELSSELTFGVEISSPVIFSILTDTVVESTDFLTLESPTLTETVMDPITITDDATITIGSGNLSTTLSTTVDIIVTETNTLTVTETLQVFETTATVDVTEEITEDLIEFTPTETLIDFSSVPIDISLSVTVTTTPTETML